MIRRLAASLRRTIEGRRLTPVSRVFGLDRGQPIDRLYIEEFLASHRSDIRGQILEVGDPTYTRRFGGERVTRSDVLSTDPTSEEATIVGDLLDPSVLPADTFDCIILTQTLQFISDPRAAMARLHRSLAPGGVLLATVPGISQISRYDMDRWGDWWRFTSLSARRCAEAAFSSSEVEVQTFGNVLVATAFLRGLASAELTAPELAYNDPDYEVVITIRAVKAAHL